MESFVTRRDCILNRSPLATGQQSLQGFDRLHYPGRLDRQQLKINTD
jgi:hypothetical protein